MAITRRRFVAGSCLAAAALRVPHLLAQTPSVSTLSGPLRGEQISGARVFRGIPFAAPPVGPRRFRPPIQHARWTEPRDATHFAAAATQSGMAAAQSSEDCLYLNLWTPDGPGPFPVYVWIHGGGFTAGTSFSPLFDGAQFAREGILTVTIAYRLGIFGFLDVSPLLGPTYAASANNGLCDVLAALEWVRDNIAAFHGDPSRVTIGGESAGAKITDTLMGIPSAQPLFHQIISESGGAERIWPQEQNLAVATAFRDHWHSHFAAADPLTVPAATLLQAQESFIKQWPGHYPLRPSIDPNLLPRLPVETIAQGSTRGKRLLLGTNRDESALFVGPDPGAATTADLATLPLERFSPIAAGYAALYPSLSEAQRRIRALTAEEYWVPSLRVADAHLKAGGDAWVYRLDFAESSGRLKGFAFHSLDLSLVWDHPSSTVENASAEAALAHQMHHAWLTFLRGEAPADPGLPTWPPYNTTTRPTLTFNTQSHVEVNSQQAELNLWDGLL